MWVKNSIFIVCIEWIERIRRDDVCTFSAKQNDET